VHVVGLGGPLGHLWRAFDVENAFLETDESALGLKG
jgi:hypothetical protein